MGIAPGDHVCAVYDNADQRFAALVPFVTAGLARGRRCVCVATEADESVLPEVLRAAGLDLEELSRAGRLIIRPGGPDLHTEGSGFQPLLGVEAIVDLARTALADGFTALQLVGEMSWALGRDPEVSGLAEFEARVEKATPELPAAMLCQYDHSRFPSEVLREVIAIHPLSIVGDKVCRNPLRVPPDQYLEPDWRDREITWLLEGLRRLQDREERLVESRDRYHGLARSLLGVQERERRSLARDLHDHFGQDLIAIRLSLLARGGARVNEALALVDQLQDQVRTLAFELRPAALDDLGLFSAARRLAAEMQDRTGQRVRLSVEPEDLRLPPDVETACFRILQEALRNVTIHSGARNVEVDLRADEHELVAEVRDDGVGFAPTEYRRSPERFDIGLLGMEERAELVGGQLKIESAPGQGTVVRARFPLRHG